MQPVFCRSLPPMLPPVVFVKFHSVVDRERLLFHSSSKRLANRLLLLSRFLYHTISTRVFSPSLLPPLLLHVRAIIFPNNALGPPAPPPPSREESLRIRSKAASDILSLVPRRIARTFFAISRDDDEQEREEMQAEIEESMLAWTDDVELNKFLIYAILEYVVIRLVPEMKGKTPRELLAERGVIAEGGADGEWMAMDMNGEKLLDDDEWI